MARRFTSASSQHVTVAAGGLAGVHGYGTVAAMFKRASTGGTQNIIWTGISNGAGSCSLSLAVTSDVATFYCNDNAISQEGPTLANTDRWYILVARKATGVAVANFSVYDTSTRAWSHSSSSETNADGTSSATGDFTIGSWTTIYDFFDGDIIAAAVYRQWVPTDAEIEALGFLTVQSWLAPRARTSAGCAVWILDQAATTTNIIDRTGGGCNQTGGTLPSISTQSVPLFGYGVPIQVIGVSSAAAVITAQAADHTYTASNETAALRSSTLASATLDAFGLSSPGRTATAAALSLIASNISTSSNPTAQTATLSFAANNQSITTPINAGSANLDFTANNLSSPRTQDDAALTFTANNVSSSRELNEALLALTANNVSTQLIATAVQAALTFTAFNVSLNQNTELPLGSATLGLTAYGVSPLSSLSNGLAALSLTAGALEALRPTESDTGGLSTTAYPVLATERSQASGLLDFTGSNLSVLTNKNSVSALLTFAAYNVGLTITEPVKYTIRGSLTNTSIGGGITNTTIGGNVNGA